MAFEFGKIGVRVYPRTKGFARKLDQELAPLKKKRIEIPVIPELEQFKEKVQYAADRAARAVRDIRVKVTPVIDKAGFAQLEQKLHDRNIDVRVDVDDASIRDKVAKVKADPIVLSVNTAESFDRMNQLFRDKAKLEIEAEPDMSQIEREIRQVKRRIEAALGEVEFRVNAEPSASFYESVHRMVDHIEDQEPEVTANVDADTGAARAKLAWLSRPRTVEFFAKLNKASYVSVASALGILSGARLGKDIVTDLKDFAKNIDRVTAKVSALAPAVATLGSGLLASSSNAFVFANSLGAILPAATALPGILTGVGVALAGSFDGLQNIHVHLREVGKELGILGEYAKEGGGFEIRPFDVLEELKNARFDGGEAFWAQARDSLGGIITEVLKPFFSEYVGMMTHLGTWWGNFFDGITAGVKSVGGMSALFAPLNESIRIAADGAQPLAEAIIRLGLAGGKYLPDMARWFVDLANSFNDWSKSTDMEDAMRRGIEAAGQLWRSLVNIGGIFSAISKAASEAGGGGLAEFEAWTKKVADGLNSVTAQTALVTYFKGAHDAMSVFDGGMQALGNTLASFADTAAVVMVKSAEAVVSFMQLVEGVFTDTGLQGAIEFMFGGIADAFSKLSEYSQPVADIFSTIAQTIGAFAPVIAEVIGEGLELIAPIFGDIMDAAMALAPVLGDILLGAIGWLKDNVVPLVDKLSEWAQENPKLATTLLLVSTAVGGLVAVVGPALTSLFSVLGVIGPLISEGGLLSGVFASVTGAIAGISAPVWGAIAGGLALVAALVALYASSEQFRNAVSQLWEALVGFIQPIIDALLPGLTLIGEGFMSLVQAVWNAFDEIVTKLVEVVATIISGLTPLTEFLGGVLGPVFTWLGGIVKAVFDTIVGIISGATNILVNLLDAFIGLISADWQRLGQSMMNVSSSVWNLITNLWNNALNLIKSIFGPPIAFIVGRFRESIGTMPGFARDALNGVKNFFISGFNNVKGAVAEGVNSVLNFFRNLPQNIRNAIGNMGNMLYNSGRSLIIGLNNGIMSAFNGVKGNIKNALSQIRRFFPFSPAKEGPFSGRGYTTYSGKAMISDWAKSAREQAAHEASTFGASLAPLQAELNGSSEHRTVIEGIQRAEPFDPALFREALGGMAMRLDTDAGTTVARLAYMGQRGMR